MSLFPPFPTGRFGVIYADPPWRFETYSPRGTGRSAVSHFDVLSIDALMTLPMAGLAAEDCALLLWVTRWLPSRAIAGLLDAWHFEEKSTAFTWVKNGRHDGNDRVGEEAIDADGCWPIGGGFGTRANPERCLLATRGKPKRLDAGVPELIIAPRREYARKPEEAYGRIERLFAGPYLELFGRCSREGWASWGDEVGRFDKGPVKTRRQPSDLTKVTAPAARSPATATDTTGIAARLAAIEAAQRAGNGTR
jgi:N6-adenosine-specific RNA methylase IME4